MARPSRSRAVAAEPNSHNTSSIKSLSSTTTYHVPSWSHVQLVRGGWRRGRGAGVGARAVFGAALEKIRGMKRDEEEERGER
jgi:hypothetical protein